VQARYELFPHDADIGVRGFGASQAEAFEQAALAMTAAFTDPETVAALREVNVDCEAPDSELLLADWLNAIVYEMATRHMLFGRFQVRIEDARLHGKAWGEEISAAKHEPGVEIKGATYTNPRIARKPDGQWAAQCVIDV
jgi:SHS2 domain-containing protein